MLYIAVVTDYDLLDDVYILEGCSSKKAAFARIGTYMRENYPLLEPGHYKITVHAYRTTGDVTCLTSPSSEDYIGKLPKKG